METLIALPGQLEIRQEGGLRVMIGAFPVWDAGDNLGSRRGPKRDVPT